MSSDSRFRSVFAGGGLVLVLLLAGGAATAQSDEAPPAFDGERALEWIVTQCELGPRTPGSEGNRRLQELIVATARDAGLGVRKHCFEFVDPIGGETLPGCNVIVSTPGPGPRIWLGAHFDSRPVSDRDPDPARRADPLVGANDGGSGTAVLLHLIEILGGRAPAVGVDLIFFDAEDSGRSGSPGSYCIGSRRLAATLGEFSSPLPAEPPRGLILLDMIGERNLRIPQEQYSLRYAPEWMEEIWSRAERLGLPAFVREPGHAVIDDHVPFLEKGIPAVDLIDFDFPEWHTAADTPEICSAESLQQVGDLLLDLLYRP